VIGCESDPWAPPDYDKAYARQNGGCTHDSVLADLSWRYDRLVQVSKERGGVPEHGILDSSVVPFGPDSVRFARGTKIDGATDHCMSLDYTSDAFERYPNPLVVTNVELQLRIPINAVIRWADSGPELYHLYSDGTVEWMAYRLAWSFVDVEESPYRVHRTVRSNNSYSPGYSYSLPETHFLPVQQALPNGYLPLPFWWNSFGPTPTRPPF
jgi:hypothetical protein